MMPEFKPGDVVKVRNRPGANYHYILDGAKAAILEGPETGAMFVLGPTEKNPLGVGQWVPLEDLTPAYA